MATYHVKRNGKLYGPFNLNSVAKCINLGIFTAQDEVFDDQFSWWTIENFQSELNTTNAQSAKAVSAADSVSTIPGVTPAANSNLYIAASAVPLQNQYAAAAEGKVINIRHYRMIACFLGCFGIHDFLAGYTIYGVIKLVLTVFGLSLISWIWSVIDIFKVTTDAKGNAFLKGGCRRSIYLLLCIFLGLSGVHHLYAGFLDKWIWQWVITSVAVVISIIFCALEFFEGSLAISLLLLLYYVATLISGCCRRSDSEGNEFV